MRRSQYVSFVLFGLIFGTQLPSTTLATDLDTMRMIVRSKICQGNLEESDLYDRVKECGDDERGKLCGRGIDFNATCAASYQACAKEINDRNSVIIEYNKFVDLCRRGNAGKTESDLAKAKASVKGKAEAADQKEQRAVEELQQLQDRSNKELLARKNREIERQNKDREFSEARKWHCYGGYGNVRRGFNQCINECERFFNGRVCDKECYGGGAGSIANGKSCFKEP
jgi:hypothetical protein